MGVFNSNKLPRTRINQKDKKTKKIQDKIEQNKLHLLKRLRGFFHTSSYKRLSASIGPFEKELETLHQIAGDSDKNNEIWYNNAVQNLDMSKDLLEKYDLQSAWKYFYAALCASTHLLKGENLRNAANVTLTESKKRLEGWRREAVVNVLENEKGDLKEVKVEDNVKQEQLSKGYLCNNDLYVSFGILTEEYNNSHIKMDIAHRQLTLLMLSSIILIPLAVFALANSPGKLEILNGYFLSAVVLFGAIGGTISGLVTASRHSTKGKIPDKILSSWSTMAKPVYGGIAALGISVFIFAGLVEVSGISASNVSVFLVLAISVLAGFSERFVLSVLRDNDIQHTQKEIVDKLDEVTEKLKAVTASEKPGAEKDKKLT